MTHSRPWTRSGTRIRIPRPGWCSTSCCPGRRTSGWRRSSSSRLEQLNGALERCRYSPQHPPPDHAPTVELKSLLVEQVRGRRVHAEIIVDPIARAHVDELVRRDVALEHARRPLIPIHHAN